MCAEEVDGSLEKVNCLHLAANQRNVGLMQKVGVALTVDMFVAFWYFVHSVVI